MNRKTIRLIFLGMLACLFVLVLAGKDVSLAVTIINGEFFIDHDPGEGYGNPLFPVDGAFDGEEEDVLLEGISITDLLSGLHVVYVRMQNSDGEWGEALATSLIVTDGTIVSASQANTIIKAEYFIDQDPGVGKGIPLPSGDGNSIGEEEAVFLTDIPLASLQPGTHVVYIRMQNSDGQWGDPASTSLIITEDSAPTFKPETGQIVAAQYAIDVLPNDDSDNINTLNLTENQYTADALWQDIDITGLALGAHRLYARLKRADGAWGPFLCYPFIVIDEDASYGEYSISEAEYFIDQDPGLGNALPLLPLDGSFDQPQEDAFMDAIDISHLSLGNHVVYVRMKNNRGYGALLVLSKTRFLLPWVLW